MKSLYKKLFIFFILVLLCFSLFEMQEISNIKRDKKDEQQKNNVTDNLSLSPATTSSSLANKTILANTTSLKSQMDISEFNKKEYLNDVIRNGFLESIQEARDFKHDKDFSDEKKLHKWIALLFEDAIHWSLKGYKLSPQQIKVLNDTRKKSLADIDISKLPGVTFNLNSDYLASLSYLVTTAQKNMKNDESTNASLILLAIELIYHQKKYYDSFYKTQLKYYFKSDNVPMNKKIDIFSTFLNRKDNELIRFSNEYFLGIAPTQVTKEQYKKIEVLVNEANL